MTCTVGCHVGYFAVDVLAVVNSNSCTVHVHVIQVHVNVEYTCRYMYHRTLAMIWYFCCPALVISPHMRNARSLVLCSIGFCETSLMLKRVPVNLTPSYCKVLYIYLSLHVHAAALGIPVIYTCTCVCTRWSACMLEDMPCTMTKQMIACAVRFAGFPLETSPKRGQLDIKYMY